MTEKRVLEAKIDEQQHALNATEQKYDEAQAALGTNKYRIESAAQEIDDLRAAGKNAHNELSVLHCKAQSALVFEICKGIIVVALLIIQFVRRQQGWILTSVWAATLIGFFVLSICRRREKTVENICFLSFSVLSIWLTYATIHKPLTNFGRTVLREVFLMTDYSVIEYAIHILSYFLIVAVPAVVIVYRRKHSYIESALSSNNGYEVFFKTTVYKYEQEVNKLLDSKHNKPVWTDDEREARERSCDYCLVLNSREAVCDDTVPVIDTRDEDTDNSIVLYTVSNADWWRLKEGRKKVEKNNKKKTVQHERV